MQGLSARADPATLRQAQQLMAAVLELHREGLARALELAGPQLTRSLAADPRVGPLLLLHDLHPLGAAERACAALDAWRDPLVPAARAELTGLEGGVAQVRLVAACKEPVAWRRLEGRVEAALTDAAPDLSGVRFERVDPAPVRRSFVPVSELLRGRRTGEPGAVR